MNIDESLEISDEVDLYFTPVKGVSPHVIKAQNDRDGLEAINKFGWLRAREIGNVLWAKNPSRHIAGARIARSWLERRLVMSKTLPYGHGPAFILTKAGADFLVNEHGITAISGKKIGTKIDGNSPECWQPTRTWQHDLIANSFLTLCMGSGYRVFSELDISREFLKASKIPDGLFEYINNDGSKEWIAIEVERANKYSSDKRQLIKSILQASLYGGIEFGEILVKKINIVYHDPLLLDGRGEKPTDHFSRLKRALEGSLRPGQTVDLIGLPVLLKGGAVIKINDPIVNKVGYTLDAMVKRLARPDEWLDLDGGFSAHWSVGTNRSPYRLRIEPISETKNWLTFIEGTFDGKWKEIPERVWNLTELGAKAAAIRRLAELQDFRNWVFDNHVCIDGYELTPDDL